MGISKKIWHAMFLLSAVFTVFFSFQNCSNNKMAFSSAGPASIATSSKSFVANAFGFEDQSGVSLGAAITSKAVVLNGTGVDPVAASCDGCSIQKNGAGPFLSAVDQIKSGDSLMIRLTAPNTYLATAHASVKVGDVKSRVWNVTSIAQPVSTCAANVGQACSKSSIQNVAGCQENYGCASFVGVYYNSPIGCDNTAPHDEWLENNYLQCTYIGFAYYDSFHNIPNGQCFNSSAAGYPGENIYTRVVAASGCSHIETASLPGTVQCDGSCQ
jgi:hypothetical protein